MALGYGRLAVMKRTVSGRYVVELPIRWSASDERIAARRVLTFARLENDVLARYLSRASAYKRDPEYRALRAERREAVVDGRINPPPKPKKKKKGTNDKHVPAAVVPRRFEFQTKEERWSAWQALRERHGLGLAKVALLTPAGLQQYDADKAQAGALTARQRDLGSIGLDAATIHALIPRQRDRVLAWLGIKAIKSPTGVRLAVGAPRFNSARRRKTTVTFASGTNANKAGAVVSFEHGTVTWKAAGGAYPIVARIRWPKNDPYIRKAVTGAIAEVKILYREVRGTRRWYVQATLKGDPPVKPALRAAIVDRPAGIVGIDVGSRHVAVVGPEAALLADFAPTMMRRECARDAGIEDVRDGDRVKKDRWVRRMQRRISRQRERNPLNANVRKTKQKTLRKTRDGKANGKTVQIEAGFKKGVRVAISRRVRSNTARLAATAAADAAARKNDHGRLVNVCATFGDRIVLERLSYIAWQRSFGRSVRRYAPGAFEAHLRQRAPLLGIVVRDVETSARLSQVCHECGTFAKSAIRGPIATRMKPACSCGREAVHRDLYSAFLAHFVREDSSVDLQAAQAVWTGAFGLLCSAQQTYDRAHAASISLVAGDGSRATDAVPAPEALRVQRGAPEGAPQASILHGSPPTSVRDAGPRDAGDDLFERSGGSNTVQTRSNEAVRAPLPPSLAQLRRRRARAGPPLETYRGKRHEIRDA